MEETTKAKTQSLIVRKVRERRPSVINQLKETLHTKRKVSAPVNGHEWSNSLPAERSIRPPSLSDHSYSQGSSLSPFREDMPTTRSCVLSPYVTITPDVSAFDGSRQTIWAAIEVSGRLSHPQATDQACASLITEHLVQIQNGNPPCDGLAMACAKRTLDRYFEFGCLYDMAIDVAGTGGASVLQVSQEQSFPT